MFRLIQLKFESSFELPRSLDYLRDAREHVQIWHMCRFCTHLSNGRFDEPQIFSNQGFRRATCRIVSSCLRTMPSGRPLCKRRISENNHSRFVGSMSR
jgi:hypothetical protein